MKDLAMKCLLLHALSHDIGPALAAKPQSTPPAPSDEGCDGAPDITQANRHERRKAAARNRKES